MLRYAMHIVFIAQYFHPETGAASERITGLAKGLVSMGHRVTVITGFPSYPAGRLYPGFTRKLWDRQQMEGVEVVRTWLHITEGRDAASRLVNYLSFMCSSFLAALLVGRPDVPDVIVATSGPIFAGASGCIASIMRRVPFVLDLRDVWPERIYVGTGMKRGFLLRLLERLELFLYRRASRIIAVTNGVRENILGKRVPPEKAVVITNGVDTDIFNPKDTASIREGKEGSEGREEVRKALGIPAESFVAIYAGTLGLLQDTSLMVEAAASVSGQNIKVLIIGGGARSEQMRIEAAGNPAAGNMIFIDPVSREDLRGYILASDLGINANTDDPHNDMAIPVKIFPYMACGLPVLIANRGEIVDIVEGSGAGRVVAPGDAGAFAKGMLEFSRNSELSKRCAEQGMRLVEARFSMQRLSESLEAVLRDAISSR